MSKLPVISGHECVKALEKAGFYLKRRESSHIVLRRDDPFPSLLSQTIRNWIEVH